MQTRSVNMSDLHKSEIARFREQQALEEEAARRGFSGYAITARHDFITARMQRGGERILQLIEEGKHEEARVLMNSENWGVEEALSLPVFESEGDREGPHPSSSPLPPLQ
jgi:hypothetical protein